MALVRFTDAALGDLQQLQRKDPQIVRSILKKCLLLERNPYAGEPLLGALVGYRKLVVGARHWRIVWRVVDEETIDVAEVWAAGARADSEVYAELERRIDAMGDTPLSHALGQIVSMLAPKAGIEATPDPPLADPIPRWLRDRLIYTAGASPVHLADLSGSEAMALWEKYLTEGSL
ncbi:MAG: type II toxin-antitoxin system RelE/ParE family toxin [Acidimicrobiia bacterium]